MKGSSCACDESWRNCGLWLNAVCSFQCMQFSHCYQTQCAPLCSLRIKAQSADQRLGASRRLQSSAEDVRRKWPKASFLHHCATLSCAARYDAANLSLLSRQCTDNIGGPAVVSPAAGVPVDIARAGMERTKLALLPGVPSAAQVSERSTISTLTTTSSWSLSCRC